MLDPVLNIHAPKPPRAANPESGQLAVGLKTVSGFPVDPGDSFFNLNGIHA
nr:hypothetical protein [Gluconobacter vitians]